MDALTLYRTMMDRVAARASGRNFQAPLFAEAQAASLGAEAEILALPLDFTDMANIEDGAGGFLFMLDFDKLESRPLG